MRDASVLRRPAGVRAQIVAAVAGIALYCGSASLPTVGLFDEEQVGDTPAYERYGEAIRDGEVPYRDFYVEYLPGALPVFALPAAGGADGYAERFKALALVLGAALVVCVVAGLAAVRASVGRVGAAAAFVGISPAVLGPVFLINFDVWPTLLAAAGVAATAHGRMVLGAVGLALAFAAKLFTLVLAPIALLHAPPGERRRMVVAAAATVVVVFAPFVALAPGALGNTVLNLVRRPLQIESLGSSLLLTAHRLGLYDPSVNSDYNSQNLGGSLPTVVATLSGLVGLAALAAVVLLFARRPEPRERLFVASAAAVACAVAFGKILSPQFLVWLVPLVALVPSAAAYSLLLVAMALTHVWFPSRYGELVALEGVSWVVLARNLALLGLLAVLVARLRRPVP